jgi:periplasmic protein TonB
MMFLALVAAFLAPPATAEEPLPGLLSLEDYPEEALNRGEQGPVTVELTISPAGRVTACKVLVSAGWSLDRATCRVITKRARFRPATDAQGAAVADTYIQTIVWRIPGVRPVRPKPNSTRM